MCIYKHGWGFELDRSIKKQFQLPVREGLEPWIAGLWVQRAHHLSTLFPKRNIFCVKTHPADCILSLILATRKSPFSSCWTQERNMRGIVGGTQMGKGEKKKSSPVNALLFSWFRWKSYFHSKEIFSSCNKLS